LTQKESTMINSKFLQTLKAVLQLKNSGYRTYNLIPTGSQRSTVICKQKAQRALSSFLNQQGSANAA